MSLIVGEAHSSLFKDTFSSDGSLLLAGGRGSSLRTMFYYALVAWGLGHPGEAHASFPLESVSGVTPEEISEAVRYPGAETERRLLDLLWADFYLAQAAYYKNKSQSGFMALERFHLALERAIGDIREVAHIPSDPDRSAAALKAHQNWHQAFLRAPKPNRPSTIRKGL